MIKNVKAKNSICNIKKIIMILVKVAIKKINENIGFLQNKIQLPQHKEKKNRTITTLCSVQMFSSKNKLFSSSTAIFNIV